LENDPKKNTIMDPAQDAIAMKTGKSGAGQTGPSGQGGPDTMFWFALASLTPALMLIASGLAGGAWPWLSVAYVTVAVFILDRLTPQRRDAQDNAAARRRANRLSLVLGVAHFVALPLGVWAIARAPYLGGLQAALYGIALALFLGQVSHPNAHELIHAPKRGLRLLGRGIYISLLFGHHASAHLKVHHVHVASDKDPNSARPGEGFYGFWLRAWLGSFRAGFRAENAARARLAVAPMWPSHPYVAYCGGALAGLLAAFLLAGRRGVLVYVALAGYAQMQVLLADYVQHYGLRRRVSGNGMTERAGPQHSWNAPQWFSSAMMLNAPRHSDHHLHPGRPFPALRLDPADMPVLPHSMPVMATLALAPPLWRRAMAPCVSRWSAAAPEGE
jgi:alkane 1-monooxygenase